ncbi:MAG: hypothetical protein QOI38_2008 [Sphingomonadales bacterium]|jgi:hypothetical protein|nr:hypothetical protein [Sphingomonadales bacterium]
MRLTPLLALLAALLPAGPAAADITARYRTGAGETMIVEANDRGDSRISRGSSAVLTRDGVSYVVASDRSGDFAVRQDELLAEAGRRARERFPRRSPRLLRAGIYRAVATGTETVGGRAGIRWELRQRDGAALGEGSDFVISRERDLAPIGRALARQFSIARYTIMTSDDPVGRLGVVPVSLHWHIRAGTVIRAERLFSLADVRAGPVPASAFALPATILPADRFLARATWIRLRVVD